MLKTVPVLAVIAAFPAQQASGAKGLSAASRSASPPLRVPTTRAWPAADLPPVAMTREERVAR